MKWKGIFDFRKLVSGRELHFISYQQRWAGFKTVFYCFSDMTPTVCFGTICNGITAEMSNMYGSKTTRSNQSEQDNVSTSQMFCAS